MATEIDITDHPLMDELYEPVVTARLNSHPISSTASKLVSNSSEQESLLDLLSSMGLECMGKAELSDAMCLVLEYPCPTEELHRAILIRSRALDVLGKWARLQREHQGLQSQVSSTSSVEGSTDVVEAESNHIPISTGQLGRTSHPELTPRTSLRRIQTEHEGPPPSDGGQTTKVSPATIIPSIFTLRHLQAPFIQAVAGAFLSHSLNNLAQPFIALNALNAISTPTALIFLSWLLISSTCSLWRFVRNVRGVSMKATWDSICPWARREGSMWPKSWYPRMPNSKEVANQC